MVSSVAAILSGLWAKSSITVMSLAVPTTSSRRRMPLNSPRCAAASASATPQAFATLSAASALATLCRPGHLQRHRDGLAGVARRHLERDPGRRPDRRRGDEIGLRGIQAVGHRLSGLQLGRERRGFRVVEIEHHRLRLGDEAAEQGAQLVQRFVIERDVVHDRHARLEIGDRAVALVHLADEDVAVADPGAGKRRARVDEVLHVRAVHDRRALAGAVQDPADHADRRGLAAGAGDADAQARRG